STGLYADLTDRTLAAGVEVYAPEFELWSDGAVKERHIWLPPGEVIDALEPDAWRFPVGTKLWKTFSRTDGRPIETRLILRTGAGPDEVVMTSYLWRADGSDADRAPAGA